MAERAARRWGGLAAVLDGAVWVLSAAVLALYDPAYWHPVSAADYLAVALYSLALLGLLPALLALHTRQRGRAGRWGRWGFFAACVGAAAAGIGNLAEDGFGLRSLGVALYLPGILLLAVGLPLLGIATLRAGVFPRWCGWALLVGLVGLVLVGRGGGFLLGVVWVALGYALLRAPDGEAVSPGPAAPPTTSR